MAQCARAASYGKLAGAALIALAIPLAAQQRPTRPAAASAGIPAGHVGIPSGDGVVAVTAALVGANLDIKPVPLHTLQLVPAAGGVPIPLRTGLDGHATIEAPAAAYRLESTTGVTLDGRTYRWSVPIQIAAGQTVGIELTNANASVDTTGSREALSVPGPPATGRQLAPEVGVYRRIRAGVVRVQAGLAQGSGFIIDTTAGLLLTNAHVVEGSGTASVVLDSALRVPAQIVHRDNDADVAVLRVARVFTQGRPQLPLASATTSAQLVEPGERLLAVGFPLHQEQTLTSGIASSVREGVVISDVNLNHGNSGGPMLNLAGEVIGINTFGDVSPDGGPGISGSILISRATRAIQAAWDTIGNLPPAPEVQLPLLPTARYSTTLLKQMADTVKLERYRQFDNIGVGHFNVNVGTPLIQYVRIRAFEQQIAKDRKKREAKANLSPEERYSELRDYRDWNEYVGDERAPVLVLDVMPRIGETGGSVFRRLMIGGRATIRFQGDLRGAHVYRNGAEIEPLVGGHAPVKVFQENQWVDLKDVADRGYYVFPAEMLAPEADGTPPSIVLHLEDLKHPDDRICKELPRAVVVNAWNDLEPLAREVAPHDTFVRADATKPPVSVDLRAVCGGPPTGGDSTARPPM